MATSLANTKFPLIGSTGEVLLPVIGEEGAKLPFIKSDPAIPAPLFEAVAAELGNPFPPKPEAKPRPKKEQK